MRGTQRNEKNTKKTRKENTKKIYINEYVI